VPIAVRSGFVRKKAWCARSFPGEPSRGWFAKKEVRDKRDKVPGVGFVRFLYRSGRLCSL
jgi:hypothetical protein